jgi:hypothetical protein
MVRPVDGGQKAAGVPTARNGPPESHPHMRLGVGSQRTREGEEPHVRTGLLTPEAGLAIVRTPNCSLSILLYVVEPWHMALTTGVNVAARPGRVGALGSFAVDAGRFGDAGAGRADRRGRRRNGALVCGWPTGRVSAASSSKRMPSQRRLRMPPRRHKTEWPYVDPNPLGAPRRSRTAVYRLLARLIRRSGAKNPDHEYVADTAVDRHHRGRRYAPAGLIEYLDAGRPVVPVAPARHRQHQRHRRRRRERDRANKPALVRSETSIGRMR